MKIAALLALTFFALLPGFAHAQGDAFTKKYSGTYHMLATGQKVTATTDKYILKQDGKATWTFVSQDADGKTGPVTKAGTWTASEGLIHLSFNMGEGEGSELISDFRYQDGSFRGSEGIFLKKVSQNTKGK